MKFKLGKKPAKNDPRDLLLKRYLIKPELPKIPSAINWTGAVKRWPMFLNDRIGDCTCAGASSIIMTAHANVNRPFTPTDDQVLKAYKDITGYNPNDPNTDTGAYLTDVLNYWRKIGIAGNKIGAYVRVNHRSKTDMMAALYLFGHLYTGIMLPVTSDEQFSNGETWSVVDRSLTGDSAIASLGGHCVPIFKADRYGYTCSTWSKLQKMTNEFVSTYFDEAFVVVHWAWIKDNGLAPSGFNMKALISDLNYFS